jgi:hypothetical protein
MLALGLQRVELHAVDVAHQPLELAGAKEAR